MTLRNFLLFLLVPATAFPSPKSLTSHYKQPLPHRRRSTPSIHRRSSAPPDVVYSRNAIVLDPLSGEVLYAKDPSQSVSIASITKLMTAIVFLAQKPELNRVVDVTFAEIDGGYSTQLRHHERLSLGDLLHMSLMCSDNVATRVLVRESGLTLDDFISQMNRMAMILEMSGTHFTEITGLDVCNVSTASDIARLLLATSRVQLITDITSTLTYEFRSNTRYHHINNTDRLLYSQYQILAGKTGFNRSAKYCFATWLRTKGHDLIAVVLGAPTNATRFADIVRLVQRTLTAKISSSKKEIIPLPAL